jgi:PhnB protein
METLNPYLHFAGSCREAMEFYRSCLGGELKLMTVGESPMAARMPAAQHRQILHASLAAGAVSIMASDMLGPDGIRKGNEMSLSLVCSSHEEVESLFAKLSAGGKVNHPLQTEFFGTHGNLTDRFGIDWMLTFEPPRA